MLLASDIGVDACLVTVILFLKCPKSRGNLIDLWNQPMKQVSSLKKILQKKDLRRTVMKLQYFPVNRFPINTVCSRILG